MIQKKPPYFRKAALGRGNARNIELFGGFKAGSNFFTIVEMEY